MPEKDDAWYDALTDEEKHAYFFDSPAMYSTEGDDACRGLVAHAAYLAETNLAIRNKKTLTEALRPIYAGLKTRFPEITDTEPRGWIAGKLDEICKANGWAYESWEGYDL